MTAATQAIEADMKNYEGSRIRTFRSPPDLDKKIEEFLKRSRWEAGHLFRTAIEEFLAKRPPGDKVAPQQKESR